MALIHQIDHPLVSGIRVGRVNKKGHYHLTASCIIYQLGNTIIDTGPSREQAYIDQHFKGQLIERVLLTHHHEDHSGNGQLFENQYNAKIYSHPNNHQQLKKGIKLSPARKMTFGNVDAFNPEPLPSSVGLDNNYRLDTIYTPGHTNDLCCFHEPNQGWLFTGDLYVSNKLKYMTKEENINQWISSIENILSLDFDTVFCSHRAVVQQGKKVLREKLNFFISLQQEVDHLNKKGYSAKKIRQLLLGREDSTAYLSFFHMSKQHMINACLLSLTTI